MKSEAERKKAIDIAQKMVWEWIEAERAVMNGQEYRIEGSRSLKRADLDMIGRRIKYWKDELAQLENPHRIRVRQIIPRDL